MFIEGDIKAHLYNSETDSVVKEKWMIIERKGLMSKEQRMKSRARVIGLAVNWNGDTSVVTRRKTADAENMVLDGMKMR